MRPLLKTEESASQQRPSVPAWISSFTGGYRVGMRELEGDIFNLPPRTDIMHRVVVFQRAGWREGNAKTKNRSEVRGGGRRPWKQKGTGRARHSSIRSPIWRGGGVVHGPVPRDWSQKLPRKVIDLGLRTSLSVKYAQGDLSIIDSYNMDSIKTKNAKGITDNHGWQSALIVHGSDEPVEMLYAFRNLPKIQTIHVDDLNVYEILKYETIVLSDNVVNDLHQRFGKGVALGSYYEPVPATAEATDEAPTAVVEEHK